MSKTKTSNIPAFSTEQIEWLEMMFDRRIGVDDSEKVIRWKAAQTDVVDTIKGYRTQMERGELKPSVQNPRSLD